MDRKAKQLVLDSAFASMINVSHSSYSSYRTRFFRDLVAFAAIIRVYVSMPSCQCTT